MRRKGMTLNELMMVILIISVVAALGLPLYQTASENVKGREAVATLRLIRTAEKVYYMDFNNVYTSLIGILMIRGYLQNPNADPRRAFNYTLTASGGPPARFTATASRIGGCNATERITLDDVGTLVMGPPDPGFSPSCVQ